MQPSLRLPKGLAIVFGALQAIPAGIFLLFAAVMGPAAAGFSAEVVGTIVVALALVALPLGLMIAALRTRNPTTCWVCTAIILAMSAGTLWIVLGA